MTDDPYLWAKIVFPILGIILLDILCVWLLSRQMMKYTFKESAHPIFFKEGFKFGAATAGYQIEENTPPSNWSKWAETLRDDGTPMCPPTQYKSMSIEHFEDDVNALKYIGAKIYRISVSWARVNPAPGVIDQDAINMYKHWIARLKEEGIEPMVTLWHFEHPLWVEEDGSVDGPNFVSHFMDFAKPVIDALIDQVEMWHTVNEPAGFVSASYLGGVHPPGHGTFKQACIALCHLFEMHAQAYRYIKSKDPRAQISYAKNLTPFVPLHKWSLIEHIIAHVINIYNRAVFRCFQEGCMRFLWFKYPIEGLKDALDFISINHYYVGFISVFPWQWSTNGGASMPFTSLSAGGRLETSDFGWGLLPCSLGCGIEWVNRLWNPRKLSFAVTENGIADSTDEKRRWFMRQTLKELADTAERVDLTMYLHWSLIDNYEWAEGMKMKFGLFEVDEQTFERKPRKSADDFRRYVDGNEQIQQNPVMFYADTDGKQLLSRTED